MTLKEIYESTRRFKEWRGIGYTQNSGWRLVNIIPFKGTKTLLTQLQCFGETEKSEHIVNIQFKNLKFVDEIPKNAEYKTLKYKDEEYYFEHPTINSQVSIRCSCSDFTYTWAFPDWKAKCLFGSKPKKYIKKTDRPPRNPDQIAGFCKHVQQAQSLLKVEDIMK